MQRGISGKTRRGPPPLASQRRGLRVVQITLVAIAVFASLLAARAWRSYRHPPSARAVEVTGARRAGAGEVIVLGATAVACLAGAAAMGLRTVRGPEVPRQS